MKSDLHYEYILSFFVETSLYFHLYGESSNMCGIFSVLYFAFLLNTKSLFQIEDIALLNLVTVRLCTLKKILQVHCFMA